MLEIEPRSRNSRPTLIAINSKNSIVVTFSRETHRKLYKFLRNSLSENDNVEISYNSLFLEQQQSFSLVNRQQFVVTSPCNRQVDLVLAVDSSGSIVPSLNKVVDNAQSLVSGFGISDNSTRIAVIDFSAVSNVHKALDTNNTAERVHRALEEIRTQPQNGETWPELALDRASDIFSKANPQRENAEKAMVVFSDGKWTGQEQEGITVRYF